MNSPSAASESKALKSTRIPLASTRIKSCIVFRCALEVWKLADVDVLAG